MYDFNKIFTDNIKNNIEFDKDINYISNTKNLEIKNNNIFNIFDEDNYNVRNLDI